MKRQPGIRDFTKNLRKVYSFNEDAIRKAERNYGYFALMTNGIKDSVEALRIYRLKDLIEKSLACTECSWC